MSLNDLWGKIKGLESELWLITVVALSGSLALSLWRLGPARGEILPLRVENISAQEQAVVEEKVGIGQFVASRTGKKYYLTTCAGAKRIKEENRVYFQTASEAQARGLTPAANCAGL